MSSKRNKVTRLPVVQKVPDALIKGNFVVPLDKQQALRDLDSAGGQLQRDLGKLELEYQSRKSTLFQQFQQNRMAYEKSLNDIANAEGVDFAKLAGKEQWSFDINSMVFSRQSPAPVQVAPPAPPVTPAPQEQPKNG